jgi:hypothetical protein
MALVDTRWTASRVFPYSRPKDCVCIKANVISTSLLLTNTTDNKPHVKQSQPSPPWPWPSSASAQARLLARQVRGPSACSVSFGPKLTRAVGDYWCGKVCGPCQSHGCGCPNENSAIYTYSSTGTQHVVAICGGPDHCSDPAGTPYCI